jgi:hypothetical protein
MSQVKCKDEVSLTIFRRQGNLKRTLANKVPKFNPARFFPVRPNEGKGLHEQASYQQRPQRKHSPGDCSHPVNMLHRVLANLGHRVQLCKNSGGDNFRHLMCWDAVSRGLRFVPTFDHHRWVNSGFISESPGPLARGSLV